MRTWRSPMSAAPQGAFVVIPEISHSDISYNNKKTKSIKPNSSAELFSKQRHAPDPRKGFFDDGLVYRAGHAQIALTAGAERIARQH